MSRDSMPFRSLVERYPDLCRGVIAAYDAMGSGQGREELMVVPWERRKVLELIAAHWAIQEGPHCRAEHFPFQEWFCCHAWIAYRKRSQEQRDEFKQLLGMN